MLIYHPAFDIYNCVFRMLQILSSIDNKEIDIERLRIWDFYLTFPNECKKIKFPQPLLSLKKTFEKSSTNPYDVLIDPKKIFERMKPFQFAALKCLASYELIDADALTKNNVRRSEKNIPKELIISLKELTNDKLKVVTLLLEMNKLPLSGPTGLKSRTGLIEFRYDAK